MRTAIHKQSQVASDTPKSESNRTSGQNHVAEQPNSLWSRLALTKYPSIQRKCDACHSQQAQQDETNQQGTLANIQPKLAIGAPDDPYEIEADAVADKVMRTPANIDEEQETIQTKKINTSPVQRLCAVCNDEQENNTVQTKSKSSTSQSASTSNVQNIISSPSKGSPIPENVRTRVEPVLGADLSSVQVHNNSSSHKAAKEISAKAFTHKNHIYLGAGQSHNDIHLMAHELTHTVQQTKGNAKEKSIVQRKPRSKIVTPVPNGKIVVQWDEGEHKVRVYFLNLANEIFGYAELEPDTPRHIAPELNSIAIMAVHKHGKGAPAVRLEKKATWKGTTAPRADIKITNQGEKDSLFTVDDGGYWNKLRAEILMYQQASFGFPIGPNEIEHAFLYDEVKSWSPEKIVAFWNENEMQFNIWLNTHDYDNVTWAEGELVKKEKTEKEIEVMVNAPIIAFKLGYNDAPFKAKLSKDGKYIEFKLTTRRSLSLGGHQIPEHFFSGVHLDLNTLIGIYNIEEGGILVYVRAKDLIDLSNDYTWNTITNIAETTGLAVSALHTTITGGVKAFEAGLLVLDTASALTREFRGDLMQSEVGRQIVVMMGYVDLGMGTAGTFSLASSLGTAGVLVLKRMNGLRRQWWQSVKQSGKQFDPQFVRFREILDGKIAALKKSVTKSTKRMDDITATPKISETIPSKQISTTNNVPEEVTSPSTIKNSSPSKSNNYLVESGKVKSGEPLPEHLLEAEIDEAGKRYSSAKKIADKEFDLEIDLGNGHSWKKRRDLMTWCRFSHNPTHCGTLISPPDGSLNVSPITQAKQNSRTRKEEILENAKRERIEVEQEKFILYQQRDEFQQEIKYIKERISLAKKAKKSAKEIAKLENHYQELVLEIKEINEILSKHIARNQEMPARMSEIVANQDYYKSISSSASKGPNHNKVRDEAKLIDQVFLKEIDSKDVTVEHIFPRLKIYIISGFEKLSREQQIAIFDLQENLIMMNRSANSKRNLTPYYKWPESEWRKYMKDPDNVDELANVRDKIKFLAKEEKRIEGIIEEMIANPSNIPPRKP